MEKTYTFSLRNKAKDLAIFLTVIEFALLALMGSTNWGSVLFIALNAGAIALYFTKIRKFNQTNMNRVIKKKLDYFIKYNRLYLEETQNYIDKEGKTKSKRIMSYAPRISYSVSEKEFSVSWLLDGSAMSKSFYELEQGLENVFGFPFKAKELVNGCMRYIFVLKGDRRLEVHDEVEVSELHSEDSIAITDALKWNFRKQPNALVTGIIGGGKTFFLIYLIKMLLHIKADIKVLDPKRSDLSQLGEYLGEGNVAYDATQIAKILRETATNMNNRYDEMRQHPDYSFGKDYLDYGYKPTVVIFDEVMAFMGSADAKLGKEVMQYLTDIIAKGRQAGFTCVLATQRADAEYIKASIRDQLGLRVALGRLSSDGYGMTFGNQFRDLQLTNYEKGDGYVFIDGVTNSPVKFSSPFIHQDFDFVKDIENLAKEK